MQRKEKIITWFLSLPHWKLFLLVFGLQLMITIVTKFPDYSDIPIGIQLLAHGSTLCFGLGWLYSIGNYFGKKASAYFKQTTSLFNVIFVLHAFALLVAALARYSIVLTYGYDTEIIHTSLFQFWSWGISLSFISTGIYCCYYISSRMDAVEQQKKVSGTDAFFTLFLFVICPIGIWFLQPRINASFSADAGANHDIS